MPQKLSGPVKHFLHPMIDLLCCFRNKYHPICLNKELHHNLQWWHQFLIEWHGASFWLFPGIHLQRTLKFPPTRLVPWALALMWRKSDFSAHGGPRSKSSLLHIRNFFQWSLLLMSGALSGAYSMFCFARTTTAWSTSSMLGLPKYHDVSCFFYVPCYWQPPVIVSHSLPNISQELPI